MTDTRQFVRWLLFVTVLIFAGATGIPAALSLTVPEPLPDLDYEQSARVWEVWEGPSHFGDMRALQPLWDEEFRIDAAAEAALVVR